MNEIGSDEQESQGKVKEYELEQWLYECKELTFYKWNLTTGSFLRSGVPEQRRSFRLEEHVFASESASAWKLHWPARLKAL